MILKSAKVDQDALLYRRRDVIRIAAWVDIIASQWHMAFSIALNPMNVAQTVQWCAPAIVAKRSYLLSTGQRSSHYRLPSRQHTNTLVLTIASEHLITACRLGRHFLRQWPEDTSSSPPVIWTTHTSPEE